MDRDSDSGMQFETFVGGASARGTSSTIGVTATLFPAFEAPERDSTNNLNLNRWAAGTLEAMSLSIVRPSSSVARFSKSLHFTTPPCTKSGAISRLKVLISVE